MRRITRCRRDRLIRTKSRDLRSWKTRRTKPDIYRAAPRLLAGASVFSSGDSTHRLQARRVRCVGVIGRRLGFAKLDLDAHVGKYGLQCTQAEHDVFHLAGVTHQAEAPDLASEVAQSGTDLQVVVQQQAPANFF